MRLFVATILLAVLAAGVQAQTAAQTIASFTTSRGYRDGAAGATYTPSLTVTTAAQAVVNALSSSTYAISYAAASDSILVIHSNSTSSTVSLAGLNNQACATALATSMSAATTGDVFYLPSGTYDFSTSLVTFPANVGIIGQGVSGTVLRSLASSGTGYTWVLQTGLSMSSLALSMTNTDAIYRVVLPTPAVNNITVGLNSVNIYGCSDCLNPIATSNSFILTANNCGFYSAFDTVKQTGPGSVYTLHNCTVSAVGGYGGWVSTGGGTKTQRGLEASGANASIVAYGCSLTALNLNSASGVNASPATIDVSGGNYIVLYKCQSTAAANSTTPPNTGAQDIKNNVATDVVYYYQTLGSGTAGAMTTSGTGTITNGLPAGFVPLYP
jgi:hypothetical protein